MAKAKADTADRKYPTIVLDRDRKEGIGEVYGEDTGGAYWFQDGLPFDYRGNLCESILTEEQDLICRRRLAKQKADAAAKEATRRAMAAAGFEEEEQKPVASDVADQIPLKHESIKEQREEVDLRAWYEGKKTYHFFKVRAAMQDRFGIRPGDSAAAREQLANEFKVSLPAAENAA